MKKKFKSTSGPKGLAASVRKLKAGIKIVDENGEEYGPFPFDRVSDDLRFLEGASWSSFTDVYFSLNYNEDFLYDIHPYTGFQYIRFKKIQNRRDKPPTTRAYTDNWGNRRVVFDVVFEVVGGKYAGMTVPRSYPYIFAADPDSDLIILNGTAGQVEQVDELLGFAGFDEPKDDIEMSDNILPALQERLLRHNEVFGGTIDEGWIQSLSFVEEDLRPEAPAR